MYRNAGLGPQKAATKDVIKYERRKNFAESVRYIHKNNIKVKDQNSNVPDSKTIELQKKRENRRKQLEYAAKETLENLINFAQ